MVRRRAIEIALITAMVLLFLIPASSANVNYSYELTTTGGTIIAEDDYHSLSREWHSKSVLASCRCNERCER